MPSVVIRLYICVRVTCSWRAAAVTLPPSAAQGLPHQLALKPAGRPLQRRRIQALVLAGSPCSSSPGRTRPLLVVIPPRGQGREQMAPLDPPQAVAVGPHHADLDGVSQFPDLARPLGVLQRGQIARGIQRQMGQPLFWLASLQKCSASNGMSAGRSTRLGTRRGNTFSR